MRAHLSDSTERWASIPGFDGYEVSDAGRVASCARVVPHKTGGQLTLPRRIMRPTTRSSGGYQLVNLYRDGKQHPRYIHALVLTAFVGPRPSDHDACHADGNRTHNSLVNLRWGTRRENSSDTVRHGRSTRGVRAAGSVLTEGAVRAIKADPRIHRLIAADNGVCRQAIDDIKSGRNWAWVT
jgi:hypothetical protein